MNYRTMVAYGHTIVIVDSGDAAGFTAVIPADHVVNHDTGECILLPELAREHGATFFYPPTNYGGRMCYSQVALTGNAAYRAMDTLTEGNER